MQRLVPILALPAAAKKTTTVESPRTSKDVPPAILHSPTQNQGQRSGSTASGGILYIIPSYTTVALTYIHAGVALPLYLVGAAALAGVSSLGLPRPAAVSILLPVAMRDFAIAAGIASTGAPALPVQGRAAQPILAAADGTRLLLPC